MARIRWVIHQADAAGRTGRRRTAVVDPAGRLAKDGRFANLVFAVEDSSAAVMPPTKRNAPLNQVADDLDDVLRRLTGSHSAVIGLLRRSFRPSSALLNKNQPAEEGWLPAAVWTCHLASMAKHRPKHLERPLDSRGIGHTMPDQAEGLRHAARIALRR
jgi:hypothetical protein